MKVKSEVTQSCSTLRNPMDCSLPGSSIRGVFQAIVLEWGAIAFSLRALFNSMALIDLGNCNISSLDCMSHNHVLKYKV